MLMSALAAAAAAACCMLAETPSGSQRPSAAPLASVAPHREPDPRLAWWSDARFGMFIHFGLYSTLEGKWGDSDRHAEWIRTTAKIPREEYQQLLPRFNPVKFDAKAIARAAKDAGMGYICITSKHHEGFALFDSKVSDWDVMSTPYGKDLLKDLADACRDEGLVMCWYYSIMDWHHPDYLPRRDWETWPAEGASFDRYVGFMKDQLRELLTGYGPIGILWFDGQWEHHWNDERGRDLYDYVRSLQPDIIVNSRVGRAGGDYGLDRASGMLGDYATPEQVIPDMVIRDLPWETCMTMNDRWGYNAADHNFKPAKDLVRKLADIAGKGGNFLLNVGPKGDGSIPERSVELLAEIGAWMRVHGESIRGTLPGPFDATPWGACTMRRLENDVTQLYLHVFEWPEDGAIRVPGLLNDIVAARVLGGDEISSWERPEGGDLVIHAPSSPGESLLPVLVVDVAGDPDVSTPPVISADAPIFIDLAEVSLASPQAGVDIHYTVDGSDPTPASPSATSLTLESTATVAARSFRGDRPVSPVAKRTFVRATPLAPSSRPHSTQVRFEYFEGEFKSVRELVAAKPAASGDCTGLDISRRNRDLNFAFRFRGTFESPADGVYRFSLGSDDGSMLLVGGNVVVDNDKPHSYVERRGDIALSKGVHEFELTFFENSGGFALKAHVEGPGMARRPLCDDQ